MGRHKLQGAGSFYLRIGVSLYAQEFICRVMPVSYEKQGLWHETCQPNARNARPLAVTARN